MRLWLYANHFHPNPSDPTDFSLSSFRIRGLEAELKTQREENERLREEAASAPEADDSSSKVRDQPSCEPACLIHCTALHYSTYIT